MAELKRADRAHRALARRACDASTCARCGPGSDGPSRCRTRPHGRTQPQPHGGGAATAAAPCRRRRPAAVAGGRHDPLGLLDRLLAARAHGERASRGPGHLRDRPARDPARYALRRAGLRVMRGRRHRLGGDRGDHRHLDARRTCGACTGPRPLPSLSDDAAHALHPARARCLGSSRPRPRGRGERSAQDAAFARGIAKALATHGFSGDGTGVAVADLATGELIYRRNGWRPLLPASTEKLFTSVGGVQHAAARLPLRHDGRRRRARAPARPGTVTSTSSARATRRSRAPTSHALAAQVRARGIRRVSGRIRGDATVFDAARWGLARSLHRRRVAAALGPRARPRRGRERPRVASPSHSPPGASGARSRAGRRASASASWPAAGSRLGALDPGPHAVRRRCGGSSASWTVTATTSRPRWSPRPSAPMPAGAARPRAACTWPGRSRRRCSATTPRWCTSPTARASRTPIARPPAPGAAARGRRGQPRDRGRSRGPSAWRGVNGTLARRLPALRGRVLAKSGTLDGVSALAGYVMGRSRAPLRVRGADERARAERLVRPRAQDAIVTLLAKR